MGSIKQDLSTYIFLQKRKLREFLMEKSVEVNTRGQEGEGPTLADGDLFVPAVPQRPHHCNQVMTVPRLQ